MNEKKEKLIRQPIVLAPNVTVIITAPADQWPFIKWDGGIVTVAVQGAAPSSLQHATAPVGETNGPNYDTPEILAAKAKLGKPFTTADAFGDMGLDVSNPDDLMSLPDDGGMVV